MSPAESALRSLSGRLPGPVQQAVGRGVRRLRRSRTTVGIVVLLYGEPSAARRSLDSALAQDGVAVEVVAVVLDDELHGLADRRARSFPGVRVLPLPDTPPSVARTLAVHRLRAASVMVLVPGAELLPGAAATLLDARSATGSSMAVGGIAGEDLSVDSLGPTDLNAAPEVARTPLLARIQVDRRRLLDLPMIADDRDGTVAAVTLMVGGFVLATTPTLKDVDPSSTRSLYRTSPWTHLDQRIAADRATLDLLTTFPDASRERVLGMLEREPLRFAEAIETATMPEWQRIVEHLRSTTSRVDLAQLDVEARAAVWLAREGRREALERFAADRRFTGDGLRTTVVDGQVRAQMPDLPEELLELSARQTSLRARLTRMCRDGDDLVLELFAAIRFVEQRQAEARVHLVSAGRRLPMTVTVHDDPAVTRWVGEREQGHDRGRLVARLPLAELDEGTWRIETTLVVDGVRRTGRATELDGRGSARRGLRLPGERRVRPRVRGGFVELRVDAAMPPVEPHPGGVTDVLVHDDAVEVVLDVAVPGHAFLVDGAVRIAGVPLAPDRWRFPLLTDPWRLGAAPAPVGDYRFEVARSEPVPVTERLLDRLPLEQVGPVHRTVLGRHQDGTLLVRLDAPLGDDEAGPHRQALLRRDYARISAPLDPELVYFQSFTGQAAGDHPLAIQQELLRRRPGTRMRWVVADSSTRVPPGAEAVQIRSREWYDVLARAGSIVTNIDLERWFERRPGQEVLQTYHGYPSKRMGLEQWRAKRLPDSWISQELARSSGTWTALLTPQPDADRYYREQYAYDGRILSLGYPRDDALVAPGREQRRDLVRHRLGIRPTQRVVLYAPTWRDDLAIDFRAAHAEHHLDLAALAEQLGEQWVVLLRGHRFHAPAADAAGGRVLNVSDYPDVNDLILAADAAILDYSSLRFDFALTGRPAVYLVPDLDRYTGRVRGFLQDYGATSPGPHVYTTANVVRELLSYDALVERWREPIATFNAQFNVLQDGAASARVVEAFFAPLLDLR